MTFRSASLLPAIWVCWCGLICSAQSPAPRFHWDWRNSDELPGKERIGQSTNFTAAERTGLIEALTSRPRSVEFKPEKEPESVAQIRIRALDLGGNGTKEFAAQDSDDQYCSPTGNCDFWILRQDGDKFTVILHRIATQTFTVQSTLTNGFHDIVLGQHGSATETGLTLYRFDGSKYQRTACYDANWTVLGKDGEYHNRKEPRITPVICTVR